MSKLAYMEWVEQTYHCWNPQVYEQEAVLECLESKNIWVRGLLLSVWAIFGLTLGKISKWGRFRTQIPANVFDHCWARKGENNLQDKYNYVYSAVDQNLWENWVSKQSFFVIDYGPKNFLRNKTFLFFKIESWSFQHLFEK